jgi:anti-sigma B factor antagonist
VFDSSKSILLELFCEPLSTEWILTFVDTVSITGCLNSEDLEKNGMAQYRRIGVTNNNDVAIVSFNDKKILDEASIQELGAELFGLVEQRNMGDILLNFTNVEFLSSAALGKLITLDRKVKASKGRMKMCNIRPEIFEVFQITKLNKVFDIRKDEAEAMTAFS